MILKPLYMCADSEKVEAIDSPIECSKISDCVDKKACERQRFPIPICVNGICDCVPDLN